MRVISRGHWVGNDCVAGGPRVGKVSGGNGPSHPPHSRVPGRNPTANTAHGIAGTTPRPIIEHSISRDAIVSHHTMHSRHGPPSRRGPGWITALRTRLRGHPGASGLPGAASWSGGRKDVREGRPLRGKQHCLYPCVCLHARSGEARARSRAGRTQSTRGTLHLGPTRHAPRTANKGPASHRPNDDNPELASFH